MSQEYTILWAGEPEDAQYGKKISVKLQEYPDQYVSLFTKYPEKIRKGGRVYGDVIEKKIGDNTYHNFKFAKRPEGSDRGPAASSGATAEIKNILNLQVMPAIKDLQARVDALADRLDHFIDEDGIQPKFDESFPRV